MKELLHKWTIPRSDYDDKLFDGHSRDINTEGPVDLQEQLVNERNRVEILESELKQSRRCGGTAEKELEQLRAEFETTVQHEVRAELSESAFPDEYRSLRIERDALRQCLDK